MAKEIVNFFTKNKDILFHFENTIGWKKLVELYEEEGTNLKNAKRDYKLILDTLGTIAGTELAPTAKETDEIGVKFDDIEKEITYSPGIENTLKEIKKAGALAPNVKIEYGGAGVPGIIQMINMEMMCKADASIINIMLTAGVAKTLEHFATPKLKEEHIPKLVSGEYKYGASMALTEEGAGSDLGSIVTKAEKQKDYWEITGRKIFITNGVGELSLVLARSDPESKGTEGISMFLVPRFVDEGEKPTKNFDIEGIEHKLGINGSATTTLNFENSIGYLVGEEGKGVKHMFYLMNEARLGVSAQALGIAQAAFEKAKEYAKERVQFGKPIIEHEPSANILFNMETDVKAMRTLLYKAAEYDDIKAGLEDKLKDFKGSEQEKENLTKELKEYSFKAREMIPLVKHFNAERCVTICKEALLLHGGNGYMAEGDAGRHLRDSLITPTYEGTSQIQALMAIKDTIKEAMSNKEGSEAASEAGEGKKSSLDKKVLKAEGELKKAVDYLVKPFSQTTSEGGIGEAMSYAMLSAERLTRLKTYTTIAKLLVDEANKFPERKPVAERFLQNYLPEIKKESEMIRSGDKSTLAYIEANKPKP